MSEGPPHLSGSNTLRLADGVLKRSAGSETVLLNLDSEEFFGVEGVGARLVELLEQPRTLDDVVDLLMGEYAVDRETLFADISELAVAMSEKNLLSLNH